MADHAFETLFDELDDVLEAERDALLTGDLEKIGRLLERKETVIEQLSILEEFDVSALGTLSEKMKRNQDLLDHALDGIRSVANRLAALRRVRTSLDTYDERGAKRTVDVSASTTVEKRA